MLYSDLKYNGIDKVYFKCKKVFFQNKEVSGWYLCVMGETAVKQTVIIQSFIPEDSALIVVNRIGKQKKVI